MIADVAINVYGKPFQTAVALLSLVKHSGKHIGKIFFIREPQQPENINFQFLYDLLSDKIVVHTPTIWHSITRTEPSRLAEPDYRRSLRYQYAWEESTARYLFVTHNDVLYRGDIIEKFFDNIGDCVAIGQIGQCWNCPASAAGVCDGDRYWDFRPSSDELIELYTKYPSDRVGWEAFRDDMNPWPLPECRLNEWTAMIDLNAVRPVTMPVGDILPFGAMTLDIGTKWFREMTARGFRFKNYPLAGIADHGWTLDGAGGHQALFDHDKYEHGERLAYSLLVNEFGVDESKLKKVSRRRWRTILKSMLPGKR